MSIGFFITLLADSECKPEDHPHGFSLLAYIAEISHPQNYPVRWEILWLISFFGLKPYPHIHTHLEWSAFLVESSAHALEVEGTVVMIGKILSPQSHFHLSV